MVKKRIKPALSPIGETEKVTIVLALMVKNEEKFIRKTLDSAAKVVDHVMVYDTGSTDGTLDKVREFQEEHPHIQVIVNHGEFVDFSTSRNEMLEYIYKMPDVAYILFMDANDELKNAEKLKTFLEESNFKYDGFYVRQCWQYSGYKNTYYNVKIIRNNKKWKYVGSVHEYIAMDPSVRQYVPDVVIYQDRTIAEAVESSGKRYVRDYELLKKDITDDPTNSRAFFYLGQTCENLGKTQEAYDNYLARSQMGGFVEEVFQSHLICGKLAEKLDKDLITIVMHYSKALLTLERAEPALALAELFIFNKKYKNHSLAYGYTSMALKMPFPQNCVLFVNRDAYSYRRYHLHSIAAYNVKDVEGGKLACLRAIAERGRDIDKNNLKFFIENDIPNI